MYLRELGKVGGAPAVSHSHVACFVQETPYLMIMELMSRGDLKTVLRDSRPKVCFSVLQPLAAC